MLRLQAEGDALLHLLTASLEPAAVPGQLLPGAPAVLLPLAAAGKELLHIVTETNLFSGGAAAGGAGFREATVQPVLGLLFPVLRWGRGVLVTGARRSLGGLFGLGLGPGPCLCGPLSPDGGLEVKGAVGVCRGAEGAPQTEALCFIHLTG